MAVKLYHGTSRALGIIVEKEGLFPRGPEFVRPEYRKVPSSEPGYVYFFDNLVLAEAFACAITEKTLGFQGEIFEVGESDVKIEPNFQLPHSWKHKGTVPPSKLRVTKIFDCKEWMKSIRR